MRYVVAGYSIVLGILFLYGVQLVWRRRRLTRAVEPVSPALASRRTTGDDRAAAGCRQRRPRPPRPGRRSDARDRRPTPRRPPAPSAALRGGRPGSRRVRWSSCWRKGIGSALDFYLPADQAVAQEASLGTKTFNLEGLVEPGSIHATPQGVNFVVTSGATSLQVDNTGQPAPALPAEHPGHRRRPLPRRRLRLRPDPGQALVELHRGPPGPGHRSERDEAMIAPTGDIPAGPVPSR